MYCEDRFNEGCHVIRVTWVRRNEVILKTMGSEAEVSRAHIIPLAIFHYAFFIFASAAKLFV